MRPARGDLASKQQRLDRADPGQVREERQVLTDEKRIKAVTVCFWTSKAVFMLDYDKVPVEGGRLSHLRRLIDQGFARGGVRTWLAVDWRRSTGCRRTSSGPQGLVFGEVLGWDGSRYGADMRSP